MTETINNRLYKIRTEVGLTQQEFAAMLGYSKNAYSNIERGGLKSEIRPQLIKAVCSIFDVNEEYLVNGNGEMFTPIAGLKDIQMSYTDLPISVRKSIARFMKDLEDSIEEE